MHFWFLELKTSQSERHANEIVVFVEYCSSFFGYCFIKAYGQFSGIIFYLFHCQAFDLATSLIVHSNLLL